MNTTRLLLTVSAVGAVALVACASNETPAARTAESAQMPPYGYAASVAPPSGESAIARIANALCDFDSACGNLGPHHDYATRDGCVDGRRAKLAKDLRPSECHGIDETRLEACLTAIKQERCENFVDKEDRIAACQRAEFCDQ